MSKVVELLRDKACYYLDHTCETIDKSLIHVPSPDTIDKIWIDSDRSIRVLNSLQTLLGHGRLANTGYVSILPVDQDIEHTAGASFAPNPIYFDPENIVKLAIEGGCNGVASTFGILGSVARKYAHKIPFIVKLNHNELLSYPNSFDQVLFGTVKEAWNMGAVAVGATIYFGSEQSRRQLVEIAEAFEYAHELGMATILWCYLRNNDFKKGAVDYHAAADLTGQADRLGVTIKADIVKQKLPTNNGGFKAIGFGKIDERMYTELASEHPIDLCRYQVANGYMGRGAGNTNTELVMQYMNRKFNSGYDIDIVLDLIDNYIDGFHNSYEWGYSIPYFLAGSHSAHVNNISYLSAKAGIASRDINFLLNRLDPVERKRYDYSLLEKTYLDYQNTHCEDDSAIASLQNALSGKDILVLLPGHTIKTCQGQIQHFYKEKNPIVISVNLLTDCYPIDFAYFSNKNRYQYWRNEAAFNKCKKIVTSNVTTRKDDNLFIIDFLRLVKCGWEQLDNSGVLLLRLLDLMNVNSISIAGFDGYSHNSENPNYVEKAMEKTRNTLNAEEANKDIKSMLVDYKNTRKSSCPISFITPSYFETVMD